MPSRKSIEDEVEKESADQEHGEDKRKLSLKIQPPPPQFPFRGHPFELSIYLVDDADQLKCGLQVPLKVDLLHADKLMPFDKSILKVMTEPKINEDGTCKVEVMIKECSMSHGNKPFIIEISAEHPDYTEIRPAHTCEMTVIQRRLVIQENLPDIWFKDEGGRDKCILVPVHLVDKRGKKVGDREVPLKVSLLYENTSIVAKQDILKLSPDSQKSIDENGQATLRLRIEDVSKNHQGQSFRIKVEADTQQCPLNNDIAYDLSSVMSVRSKRNKRTRSKMSAGDSRSSFSSSFVEETSASTKEAFAATATADSSLTHGRETPTSTPTPTSDVLRASESLDTAMNGLIQWTGSVVDGLHALEWQLIGYESLEDGSPDQSRPIYRCPSCWRYKDVMTLHTAQHGRDCVIANILMNYATETMGHLHSILKGVRGRSSVSPHEHDVNKSTLNGPSVAREKNESLLGVGMTPGAGLNKDLGSPLGLSRNISDLVGSLETSGSHNVFSSLIDSDPTTELHTTRQSSLEPQVHYILAKIVALHDGPLGFPAFDVNKRLLGFFKENRAGATTKVIFIPINNVNLSSQDETEARKMLNHEAESQSGAVFSLSSSNHNLSKLKEDALLYHWGTGSNSTDNLALCW